MIFQPASRYPADPRAVFILALAAVSGFVALLVGAEPGSLEEIMPAWAVFAWSLCLVVGSAVTLTGMAFQSINGIIVEQVGSVMVGAASLFYSGVLYFVIGEDATFSASIITGWGVACLGRWLQLQILINNAHKRQIKQQMLARVYAEIDARNARELERKRDWPGREL